MAVDLEPIIRDRLMQCSQQVVEDGDKVNLVALENLHITLNFLGDVEDELLHEVLETMSAAAGELEPFDVDVVGATAVPHGGPVRMLWASIVDPTGSLVRLYRILGDALGGMGVRQEQRGYKPHVTLARVKYLVSPGAFRHRVSHFAHEDFGVQHVDEIVAYTSILSREGPTYAPLARSPLGE